MLTEPRKGAICAASAFGLWGIAPIYFKLITTASPMEIVCHRIIWSALLLLLVVYAKGDGAQLKQLFVQKRLFWRLCLTTTLIFVNWLTFIWAVNNNRMMDASLGYFINPLVNIFLGFVFLQERLSPLKWFAVALAAAGVTIQIVKFGSVPYVALTLAFAFSLYALIRKKIHVNSLVGLLMETLIMLPVALVYLFFFADSPTANMLNNTLSLNLLLMAAGPITTLPLLLFTAAAVRLPLSTLGFFQYLAPSLMFLLAFFIYKEPFHMENGITFVFIWVALGFFSYDALHHRRVERRVTN